MNRSLLLAVTVLLGLSASLRAAEPKKLLVISATAGARHASIPNGEKMLREVAAKSNGQFTLVMLSDAPDYPFSRLPGGGRGTIAGFPGAINASTPAQQDALTLASAPVAALNTAVTTARTELTAASLSAPATIAAKADALAAAELDLALARAAAIAQVQATANRFSPELLQALSGAVPAGRGGSAPDRGPALAKLFQEIGRAHV